MKRASAVRRLVVSGGLVAAAFAIKYPLIGIPNVEPFTLAFFCVGYMFGPAWGLFVGAAGETIYATINQRTQGRWQNKQRTQRPSFFLSSG